MIATDIDEVLFPFVREFAVWHNQEYGTSIADGDFVTYEFEHVLGVTIPETIHRVHTFLRIEHGHLGVSPLEEAENAISLLGENFDLAAVTARHPEFETPTMNYLMRYFRGVITNLTLVGHPETMDIMRTKAEVCAELAAIALIDDSVKHVSDCAREGIQGILFGSYPWNQTDGLPAGVVRYENWDSVLEHFGVRG